MTAGTLALVLLPVGLMLALWIVTRRRAARHEAAAEAEHPPEGRIVEIDGARVHAVVMGQGPDVVLIHGSSGNTRDMTFRLAPRLAERYRVIVFDRPGLGHSDPGGQAGTSLAGQAGLLMRAARALGAERPIVVGQSYGGAVALAWAVHHPEAISALVPVAAAAMPWTTPLDLYNRIAASRLGSALALPLITAFVSDARIDATLRSVFRPQDVPAGFARHFGPGLTLRRRSLRANAVQRARLLSDIIALRPRYAEISVPTEIVHGSADDTVGFEHHAVPLARLIPGAVLTRLEGIGHMPHHVAVEDVVAAVDRAALRAGLR